MSSKALFSGKRFRAFLEERLPAETFDELEIPLHVVTTHLATGDACRLSEGDLRQA